MPSPSRTALPRHRTAAGRAIALAAAIALVLLQARAGAQVPELPQVLMGPGGRFDGAQAPVVDGTGMVINQTADKATLHWQSFNIGAGNRVEFVQPSSSSVALNRIFDALPSQIRGQLEANGQVYLINPNGIVFGEGAQVNTQSLVASTLGISDQVFGQLGIVNAINSPSGPLPAFDAQGQPMGEILVEQGALLESAANGRILVFAPKITNEGTISTPDGQQVLAAAQDRVYLAASQDSDLRGLLVEVSTGGEVNNLGTLIAERGSITLLGLAVNQQGVARATTGVALNGGIRLQAQDMNGGLALVSDLVPRTPKASRGGELTLGEGSVTEVIPDTSVDEDGKLLRATDAQGQPRSRVDLAGRNILVDTGARVTVTGGTLNLVAAADPTDPALTAPANPEQAGAEIRVRAGAILDVAGDRSTEVSVARNVVSVEARGNELADSPLQQDGPIRNQTLQVDIRRGTPFLNTEGAEASITRTAAERLSAGGSITARSEGGFVLEEGARIDISGGQVTYTADTVTTSRLLQANGQVVDISQADPNQRYLGVAGTNQVQEAGYIEGRDAGSLNIQSRGLALDGTLAAAAPVGVNQRRRPDDLSLTATPAYARSFDQAPLGGALALNLLRSGLPELVIGAAPEDGGDGTPPFVLSAALLEGSGLTRIGLVNAGGAVRLDAPLTLPAWSTLSLTGTGVDVAGNLRIPGGQLTLNSSNTTVGESLVPNAALLTRIDATVDLSGSWVNDSPLVNRGRPSAPIVLDGGSLNVNSGGSIEVTAGSLLDVSAGAWLDAAGRQRGGRAGSIAFRTGQANDPLVGARLAIDGVLRAFGFTSGGNLTLETERLQVLGDGATAGNTAVALDGAQQFGLREIGSESGSPQYVVEVGAAAFQQGGFQSWTLRSSRADLEVADGSGVRLRSAALQQSSSLAGRAASGTPMANLFAPVFLPAFQRLPMQLTLAINESLGLSIGPVADLRIGDGARIVADAGSRITLNSTTDLYVEGMIEAPGGTIDLNLGGGPGVFRPTQKIWLGPESRLAVNGVALIDDRDPRGLLTGRVLDGGTVSLRANQGSIVGAPGASIEANGASAQLDIGARLPVRTTVASAGGTIRLNAAESLIWQGGLSAAAPAGSSAPGGRLVVGLDPVNRGVGPLLNPDGIPRGPHVFVMQDYAGEAPAATGAVATADRATGWLPLAALESGGFTALDVIVRSSAVGSDRNTGAPIPDTPDSLPIIEFPTDLALTLDRSIVLDAAILRTGDAQVALSAPYVALGYSDPRVRLDGAVPDRTSASNPQVATQPIRLTPTAGAGLLTVTGELIELVGELVTRGFGSAAEGIEGVILRASEDVRFRGVRKQLSRVYRGLFRTAGDLVIDAPRVYPTTLTEFSLEVEGVGGTLTLTGGNPAAPAPLSVDGRLTLRAARIVQDGALFAPLGQLDFIASESLRFTEGSLTSTSGFGVAAPFFRTEPGGALVLPPASGTDAQLVFVEQVQNPLYERELPQKRIGLSAPDIDLAEGSRFDLSGGSDIAATEFVPGPGGSRDILLADLDPGPGVLPNGSFAILPGISSYAPWDPLESPAAASVQGLRIGDTLVLADAIPGLPAGEYALLPARYALFGGYLVTPQAGHTDLPSGQGLLRSDGVPILAGRLGVAGSEQGEVRTRGFAIETGEQVRRRAEYLETPLEDLYVDGVLRNPRDAGNLVIEAGGSLNLQAELVRREVAGGLGSAVDIATAAALAVVREFSGLGGIELRAADLAGLGADSLLVGGKRTRTAQGLTVAVTASEVNVQDGVELAVPELLLVGGRVNLGDDEGAATRLESTAPASGRVVDVLVQGDAAVLAISDRELRVQRGSTGTTSRLTVSGNSTLAAAGSLVLDASGDVDVAGTLAVGQGTLSLGAGRISLGETGGLGAIDGLVLSNENLALLSGSDLRLRSSGLIDIYGELAAADGLPLAFRRLVIDAPALRGVANEGATAVLLADVIELGNGSPAQAPAATAAAGSALELRANQLWLGEGQLAVTGFAGTVITTAGSSASAAAGAAQESPPPAVVLAGRGGLAVDGSLRIDTPVITGLTGADATITASGGLVVTGADAEAPVVPATAGLGARLVLAAPDIHFGSRIVLPSGLVELVQTASADPQAGLRLATDALVDVSGAVIDFGPVALGTPGGSIALRADSGDLELAHGVRLDASAAAADAGEIRLDVPQGELRLADDVELRAAGADGVSGRFLLDADRLALSGDSGTGPLAALGRLLADGGIGDLLSLRLRGQDLAIEPEVTLAAREIRLVADTGSVTVDGTLDASGAAGGRIELAAGDRVDLNGTLLARGSAEGAAGGRVDLVALDADGDDPAGLTDTVNLNSGALVDVAGGPGGSGGEVFVHVRRLDSTGNGQTDRIVAGALDGEVAGAARAQLVATRVLRDPGATSVLDPVTGQNIAQVTVNTARINEWRNETAAFMAALPEAYAGPLQVAPGLQVESTGNLVLANAWNLYDGWYFGRDLGDPAAPVPGVTGVLSLRAAGNLTLQADLSDAFDTRFVFGFFPVEGVAGALELRDADGLLTGRLAPQAWNYRLVAGADLASADPLATGPLARALTLNAGVRARTGTGDIEVASSGNVRLLNNAAIYSAGYSLGTSDQLNAILDPALGPEGLSAEDLFLIFLNGGQFVTGGGQVTIGAGGDVLADTPAGGIGDWLPRVGSSQQGGAGTLYAGPAGGGFGAVPTHWGVAFDRFRNGIGAFGGGDLRIEAGGDLRNLALALPSTGRALDGVAANTAGGQIAFLPSQRTTEVLGGGNLFVRAGGEFRGGRIVLGGGDGQVRTTGDSGISGGAPLVALGSDSRLDWLAGGAMQVGGLSDPTVAALSSTQLGLMSQVFPNIRTVAAIDNRFFTYSPGSQVTLGALSGQVRLDGTGFGQFLPPSLTAVSFGGDVNIVPTPLRFFPSPLGQLELLAAGNVTGNFAGSIETRLTQSDQDRATLPSIERPELVAVPGPPALVPLRIDDPRPNLIVALNGSVQSQPGRDGYWNLDLAKPAIVKAGEDISNVSIRVQNLKPDSVTSFEAGGSIVQRELRTNTGRFASNDRRSFEIWGPGHAEFIAGGDIRLGTSAGIETIGNAKNPALPEQGASLLLLAGTGGEPAYDRFIEVFLSAAPSAYRDDLNLVLGRVDAGREGFPVAEPVTLAVGPDTYAKELSDFLVEFNIPLRDNDPVATFQALSRPLQRVLIGRLVFAELKEWGSAAETPERADRLNYVRGYAALDTLFAAETPLVERAAALPPGALEQQVRDFLTLADRQAANDAQVALLRALFPAAEPAGDISLLLSQVQTLSGGDLKMLAPTGDINAGAANADIIAKAPADLGIVTARGGDIDILAGRDLLVNSTRAFALQGDLLIWSSFGSIDAGKGAKTVTSVPDPIISIDPNTGQTIIEFPPAVSGSGLQGQNAALFAPQGSVNAGDAGIRTSGDLTIGAVEIVGADNINVGGVEVGFSTGDVVAVAPPGATSAGTAATRGLGGDAGLGGSDDEAQEAATQRVQLGFITVDVLGFGEPCNPDEEDCD